MSTFDVMIQRVLENEGGYSNRNPKDDPGGETYRGVARASHPGWAGWPLVDAMKGSPNFPAVLDTNDALQAQVKTFYLTQFWNVVHGDDLAPLLAFQALDFAVNSGAATAIRKLQAAAGVADDGRWGPVTAAAVAAANPTQLGALLLAARMEFCARLANWPANSAGWTNRFARDLRYLAQDLA